jgi:hypothetical protein
LLVARVFANHADDALPLDQFALLANAFDAGANFHVGLLGRQSHEIKEGRIY